MEIRAHLLPIGKIEKGQCTTLGQRVEEVLADHITVLCIAPFAYLKAPEPIDVKGTQVQMTAPTLIQCLMVVATYMTDDEGQG